MTTEMKRKGGLPPQKKIDSAIRTAQSRGTLRKSMPQWLRDVLDYRDEAQARNGVRGVREQKKRERHESRLMETRVTRKTFVRRDPFASLRAVVSRNDIRNADTAEPVPEMVETTTMIGDAVTPTDAPIITPTNNS